MNKNYTHSHQSSKKIITNTDKNLQTRVKFLQDYCRAYTCLKTSSLNQFEFFLN